MFSIHFFRYRCRNTRTDFIEILRNPSLLVSLLISLFSARWSVRVISLLPLQKHSNRLHRNIKESVIASQFVDFAFLSTMVSSSNFAFREIVSRTFKNKQNSKNVLDTFLSLPLQRHSNRLHRNIKESVIASQFVDFAFLSTMVSSGNFFATAAETLEQTSSKY